MATLELPRLLAGFDPARLTEDPSTLVALDREHVIVWVNAAWTRFARENGGESVLYRFGPGTSYLSGIDPLLRGFFETAFENAMLTDEQFELDYECSSAMTFRSFHMVALPIAGKGLLIVHSQRVQMPHQRDESVLTAGAYRLSSGIILQCANCRRVRRADASAWDWVPSWVDRTPPRTSHGICAACRGYYWGAWSRGR